MGRQGQLCINTDPYIHTYTLKHQKVLYSNLSNLNLFKRMPCKVRWWQSS